MAFADNDMRGSFKLPNLIPAHSASHGSSKIFAFEATGQNLRLYILASSRESQFAPAGQFIRLGQDQDDTQVHAGKRIKRSRRNSADLFA